MSTGPALDSGLEPPDRDLVDASWVRLRLAPMDSLERLSVGRSGSLVVRLGVAGQRVILKITTDPARLSRARSELDLIAHAPAAFAAVMPRYIAGHDAPDAVCLVTEEHRPLPNPRDIPAGDWSAMATALGYLHNQPVPAWPGLEAARPPDEWTVNSATTFWAQRAGVGVADRAMELIQRHLASEKRTKAPPLVEHGDCHTENIVRDEVGTFRWIDWQEARIGDGCGDLAFLWQRAEFAGGNPPRVAMTAAYRESRRLGSAAHLGWALDAAELQLLFISWPPFLGYGAPEDQQRMMRRLRELVDALSLRPEEDGR